MAAYNQGDPRQKIQLCWNCGRPTGQCEEDSYTCHSGDICCHEEPITLPWCRECYWEDHIEVELRP